ncbi:unnamed protein product, partial [marine sediment metagenome]
MPVSADKLNKNKDKFDKTLRQALQLSSGPSPADFTERILRQIRQAEERRILARVVLQERLALAGCIVLGTLVIVMAAVLPGVAGSFTERIEVFISKIGQATETLGA